MGDIANAVGTFLTLATDWYKNAAARNTASASLVYHLKSLNQFQAHIQGPLESIFLLHDPYDRYQQLDPLILAQAVRVVHLNASLQEWLFDAGFRPVKRRVEIIVARRPRGSALPQNYFVKRRHSEQGQLTLPWFGVTGKESAFITLFDKLEKAYEKLEAAFPSDAYGIGTPASPYVIMPGDFNFDRPGLRGGYNHEVEGQGEEAGQASSGPSSDHDSDQWPSALRRGSTRPVRGARFLLTERQKLHQEEMLQGLSNRLEENIADMMISNGDGKKLRERRRLRRPLQDAQREILAEKSLEADQAEAQKLRMETQRARREAEALRSKRMSSRPLGSVHIDDYRDERHHMEFVRRTPRTKFPAHEFVVHEGEPLGDGTEVDADRWGRRPRDKRPAPAGIPILVDEGSRAGRRESALRSENLRRQRGLHKNEKRDEQYRRRSDGESLSSSESESSTQIVQSTEPPSRFTKEEERLREALREEQKQREEDRRKHVKEVVRLREELRKEQEQSREDRRRYATEIRLLREAQQSSAREPRGHRIRHRGPSPSKTYRSRAEDMDTRSKYYEIKRQS